jgi:hypothetical protein
MITDIPSHTDFSKTALSLLNLAWESALELAVSLDEAKKCASGIIEDDSEIPEEDSIPEDEYWAACQTQLATSISLVQQAAEFLLKSRIAEVSPFLLIGGTPKAWPKECNKRDLSFADFFMIEAQELVKAHDTVVKVRLPEGVEKLFEEMRRLRNGIMHTVDERLTVEVKQVALAILEISDWFIGPKKWVGIRREHIENSPTSLAYSSDASTYLLARELMKAVDLLSPSEAERLLGFDKRQRRYICRSCTYDCKDLGLEPNLALLQPNTPESKNLHCYVCENDHPVVRRDCDEPDCKGNVLDEDECCLTCNN